MTDTNPEDAANLSLAKQVCPTCKGTGQTQYSSIPSSGPMIRMVGQWEDCTDCRDADGKPTGARFPTLNRRKEQE